MFPKRFKACESSTRRGIAGTGAFEATSSKRSRIVHIKSSDPLWDWNQLLCYNHDVSSRTHPVLKWPKNVLTGPPQSLVEGTSLPGSFVSTSSTASGESYRFQVNASSRYQGDSANYSRPGAKRFPIKPIHAAKAPHYFSISIYIPHGEAAQNTASGSHRLIGARSRSARLARMRRHSLCVQDQCTGKRGHDELFDQSEGVHS